MWKVDVKKTAAKELEDAPDEISDAFEAWKILVESSGPEALAQVNGYWDHALKGEWKGARSSSLNKNWRVIYWIENQTVTVTVVRITKHDYRR